ncbi:hypothetical protein H6F43_13205 [Leptolyngbya sp. FACHB-36]|uniref:hypothetical protein n=1 Tax=Leptolyngbya sp. FACHB-36 TaxID=2692808 RepID=UPI00167FEB7C|nr:hypothetical protein [Leptolyngbya sp. FACHB-36]MBD2021137.1 hypothetical protein [Leptolyngbya sp. FACHB-36]
MTPAELAYLGITVPLAQDELPYNDGEPTESQRHKLQMQLLMDVTEVAQIEELRS